VIVSTFCFRRCLTLALVCFAIVSLNAGCHSTNSTPNPGGTAKTPGSSWSLFAPEPKKIQTPSDFISQPRP